MSAYGTKVVAVLDTSSAFSVTIDIKQMRDNIITLQDNFATLTGLAPGSLDTLAEIATALQDLQTRTFTLESALIHSLWQVVQSAVTLQLVGNSLT